MSLASGLVRLHAAALLALGLGAVFAPELLAETEPVLAQIVGGALFGFAIAAWTVRDAPLGGIYGRAVVSGQQAFAVVGALVALRGVPADPSPARWALLGALAFGAVLWSVLLYRPGWLGARPAG